MPTHVFVPHTPVFRRTTARTRSAHLALSPSCKYQAPTSRPATVRPSLPLSLPPLLPLPACRKTDFSLPPSLPPSLPLFSQHTATGNKSKDGDPLASSATQKQERQRQQQQEQQQQPKPEIKVLPKGVAKGPVIDTYSSVHNSINGDQLSITTCTTTMKKSDDTLTPPPSQPQPVGAAPSPPKPATGNAWGK